MQLIDDVVEFSYVLSHFLSAGFVHFQYKLAVLSKYTCRVICLLEVVPVFASSSLTLC